MYRNWYEAQCTNNSKIKFYNATEGGVIINAMENITLQELIDKFDNINIQMDKNDRNMEDKIKILESLKNGLMKIDKEIISLKPYTEEAINLCYTINDDLSRHRKVDKLISKLDEFDIKILNISKVNEFLGITMQKTIKTITEGFEFKDETMHKSIVSSFKLYEAMKDSIDFNHYIIERALIKINKELE